MRVRAVSSGMGEFFSKLGGYVESREISGLERRIRVGIVSSVMKMFAETLPISQENLKRLKSFK